MEVIDIESIFDGIGFDAYADDVHPNAYGYNIITGAVNYACGITFDNSQLVKPVELEKVISKNFYNITASSDSSGSLVTIHAETLTPPLGSNKVRVSAKLVAGGAGDIEDHQYNLKLTDVSSGSSVVMDIARASQAASALSGVALATVNLAGEYTPSNLSIFDGGDILIEVQGRDYNLASTNATHKMTVEWVT